MKRSFLFIVRQFVFLSLLVLSSGSRAFAQITGFWSPLMVVPGYLDDTLPPYLVVDQQKTVHAFASQWVGENRKMAVVYCRWTKRGGWTMPVDILLSPSGDAQVLGAFLDRYGIVHVIFRGGDSRASAIFYSQAPIDNADFAPAWSEPVIIGERSIEPGSAAFTGDDQGILVVLYSGKLVGNGVYATYSSDAGESWSNPTPVFLTGEADVTPYYLKADFDQAGVAHAVWSDTDATGNASRMFYTRFNAADKEWDEPIVLAQDNYGDIGAGLFGPAYPEIIAANNRVVVVYNANGGTATVGRPALWVRLSDDGGQSWTDPYRPFPRHVGLSGGHDLVSDSNGVVHVLFIQRIEQTVDNRYSVIGGLWHSELKDDHWTEPDRFYLGGDFSGYDVSAEVSQGNQLLVTLREDPGLGAKGIYYASVELNAPELPVAAFTTVTPAPTLEPEISEPSTSTRTIEGGDGETVNRLKPVEEIRSDASSPIIFAIVPVVLLITAVVIVRYGFHKPAKRNDLW